VLSLDSDVMLGIDPDTERVERVTELPFGSTLLLFTDGLVERREESIAEGLDRLAAALGRHGDLDLEALCDAVLADVLPPGADDDTALLALRPVAPPSALG
jgi:serine phosphatase RsbU (regulator of sigma subunit)